MKVKVRATLVELWEKITPFKEQEKVFWNGENNDYSEEIERVTSNSPTGARSKEMFSKFIFGKGIDESIDVLLDSGMTLSEVAKEVVDDVVEQNGAFIHTTYGIDIDDSGEVIFLPKTPKSLNYNKCRISQEDDDGNKGMILYKNYNKHDRNLTKKEKDYKRKYYPFNPRQAVVMAQINADAKAAGYDGEEWSEKIKYYRGQVMYLNLTPKHRYAISKFDSVFNDLDTEYRIGLYTNKITKDGFLGKLAVLTQGLDEETAKRIKETVQKWLGAENSASIVHLDVEQAESLDNILKIINVPSQYDEKQFQLTRKFIRTQILGAANNLPEPLAFADSGAMFDSGEKYEQLKKFYWEQCEWERQKIEDAFYKLGYEFNFLDFNGSQAVSSDEVEASPEANEETLQAQASLRGSVGGVQGILGIQQSVSQGLTDFESAITILMEIYGFNRSVSSALLGKPEIRDGNSNSAE